MRHAVAQSTKGTVTDYLAAVRGKEDWTALLTPDVAFTSFANPMKTAIGRTAVAELIGSFYLMITSVIVRDMLVEGDRAVAMVRYELTPPAGSSFESHVAELYAVRDGRISSIAIFFDLSPYPRR